MDAVNPEWVEAGARADVPAASYVCNPADGHHWVSQLSQERIWVQTCSLCREIRLDIEEHDALIRADERERREEFWEARWREAAEQREQAWTDLAHAEAVAARLVEVIVEMQSDIDHAWAVANGEARR